MKVWGIFLAILLGFWAPCADAKEPRVGPKDGQAGPSLPAVVTPHGVEAEALSDRPFQVKAVEAWLENVRLGKAEAVPEGVKDGDLLDAVHYGQAWMEAKKGEEIQTFGLEKAERLKARVAGLDTRLKRRADVAFWLGLIPGFGHAYIGLARVAGVSLGIFALLAWAWLFAWKNNHLPYVILWGLVIMAFISQSAGDAMRKALKQNIELRAQAMDLWVDLVPDEVLKGVAGAMRGDVKTLQEGPVFGVMSSPLSPTLPPSVSQTAEVKILKGDVFRMGPPRVASPSASVARGRP